MAINRGTFDKLSTLKQKFPIVQDGDYAEILEEQMTYVFSKGGWNPGTPAAYSNTFIELPDTPDTYNGSSKKNVIVNEGADALIFSADIEVDNLKMIENGQSITNFPHNSGCITPPTFTDNGDGTATIISTDIFLYDTKDFSGTLKKYMLAEATLSFIDGMEEYVVADYNNGLPIIRKETDKTLITGSDIVTMIIVWRQGNILHSIDQDSSGLGLANKLHRSMYNTVPYRRSVDGGLVISELTSPNPRTIAVTAGVVYAGALPVVVDGFISNTDTMTEATITNGVWSYADVLVYDNTKYNPSTGPADALPNKYLVRWFYRSVGDENQVFYVMGNSYYTTIADAEKEGLPMLPILIRDHCMLVGRSIIKNGDTSGIIKSTFDMTFTGSTVISHNDTLNIQGGVLGSYYHSNQPINTTDDPHFAGLTVGGLTDYSEFEADGTLAFKGAATVWNDLILPVSNLRPGNTPPVFAAFTGGIYAQRFDAATGDEVHGSFELQHDYKEGSNLYVHCHWSPTTDNTGNVVFGFEWSHANTDGVFSSALILSGTPVSAGGVVNKHYLYAIGIITGTGYKIGDIITFRFFRQNGGTDTFTGNAFVHSVGVHYEADTVGSRQITAK